MVAAIGARVPGSRGAGWLVGRTGGALGRGQQIVSGGTRVWAGLHTPRAGRGRRGWPSVAE